MPAPYRTNTVPMRGEDGEEYAVKMHPAQPLVEKFLVPIAWVTAGFILAKLTGKPQVIRGM